MKACCGGRCIAVLISKPAVRGGGGLLVNTKPRPLCTQKGPQEAGWVPEPVRKKGNLLPLLEFKPRPAEQADSHNTDYATPTTAAVVLVVVVVAAAALHPRRAKISK
jgi:hypothetical protein